VHEGRVRYKGGTAVQYSQYSQYRTRCCHATHDQRAACTCCSAAHTKAGQFVRRLPGTLALGKQACHESRTQESCCLSPLHWCRG
jgi:hypothetical protein